MVSKWASENGTPDVSARIAALPVTFAPTQIASNRSEANAMVKQA
jgi:hypothetical protein